MRDELIGEELIGEYLLWHLNKNKLVSYRKKYNLGVSGEPIHSFETVLSGIARSIGGLVSQGELNRNRAAKKFLFDYRNGKLGALTLDDPPPSILNKKEID